MALKAKFMLFRKQDTREGTPNTLRVGNGFFVLLLVLEGCALRLPAG
ncbi:MAG TPA: hypothetical protein VGH07_06045 [Chthoniobacterales bacterium]